MPTKTKVTRPTSTTHKKRRGDHHRQSKHYLKVYWPYVPMLFIVMIGLFFGSPARNNPTGVLAYATEMSNSQLLSSTNSQRAANGKASLTINSKLSSAAPTKANDMAARNYWSHTTPDGKEPWYFVDNAGYSYLKAGENLAYGFNTSGETVTGWMNSPTHRDNLLDSAFTEVGFGFVDAASYNNSGEETIVVAMYGQPQVAAAQTAPSPSQQQVAPATTQATPSTPAETPAQAVPAPAATETPTIADTTTPASDKPQPVTTASTSLVEPETQQVTKLQTMTGGKLPWIAFAVGLFSGAALLFLSIKHSLAFKRTLIHGEQFLLHHPLLDITLTAIIMTGYVLSHTTGFIK